MKEKDRYYNVIEASELLETSGSTVCMLVNRGELDVLRFDERSNPVFTEDNLLNYMIRKETEARA